MRAPVVVRSLTADESRTLQEGLRSKDAFTLRRCQILLARGEGKPVKAIAAALRCGEQTVREAIHAFNAQGSGALQRHSNRPKCVKTIFDEPRSEQLRALIRQSPRAFGKTTGLWSTGLLADVALEQGITDRRVTAETVRLAIQRLGLNWKRAKKRIASPDGAYARKKSDA